MFLQLDGLRVHLFAHKSGGKFVGGNLTAQTGSLALVVKDCTKHIALRVESHIAPDGTPQTRATQGNDHTAVKAEIWLPVGQLSLRDMLGVKILGVILGALHADGAKQHLLGLHTLVAFLQRFQRNRHDTENHSHNGHQNS